MREEVPKVPDAPNMSNPMIGFMLCLIANQLGKENPQYSDQDKPISYNMGKNMSLEAEIKSRKKCKWKKQKQI